MGSGGSQIGEAFIPIRGTLDKLDGDLAQARGKVEGALSGISKLAGSIGESLQKVGKFALGGIAAGIAGITAIVTGATAANISWAETLDSIGDVLGTTTEQSAALAVAVQHIGGSTEQLTSQLAFMSRGLETADGKIGPTGEALKGLGINFKDAQGNIRPATDILQDVADKIGAMPDGLEKTSLMMDVFGKSGKDMSDLMAAVANGGMAEFSQQAKDMGLSMSDNAVNGAIALNRTFKDLKMAAQGVLVSLGTALLPIIKPLADGMLSLARDGVAFLQEKLSAVAPIIDGIAEILGNFFESISAGGDPLFELQTALLYLAELFGMSSDQAIQLATDFGGFIAQIQAAIASVVTFLEPIVAAITSFISWQDVLIAVGIAIASVVLPALGSILAPIALIVGVVIGLSAVVAALRHAWETDWGGIQEKAAAVWAWLQVAFADIKAWLSVAIPVAIQILSDFWSNVLRPAMAAVFNWLSTVLMPFITGTVVPWLKEHIPQAIQTLSDFWTNVLWPAMQAVWGFIKNTLIPIFLDVVGWLATNIPTAINTAAGFWNNTLKPALDAVYTFIKTYVWPTFLDVGEWLLTTIGTAITTAAGFWRDTLKPAIDTVWTFLTVYVFPTLLDISEWLGTTIGNVITTAAGFWKDTLQPALEGVWKFINESLLPIFKDVGNYFNDTLIGFLDAVKAGWNGIKDAANFVVGAIQSVIEWIKKAVEAMPDWLIPGSPTPFEIGLRGIAKGFKDIAALQTWMPDFGELGASMPALSLAGAESSSSSGSISYSSETTIHTNQDPLRVLYASRHLDKLGRVSR